MICQSTYIKSQFDHSWIYVCVCVCVQSALHVIYMYMCNEYVVKYMYDIMYISAIPQFMI